MDFHSFNNLNLIFPSVTMQQIAIVLYTHGVYHFLTPAALNLVHYMSSVSDSQTFSKLML